MWLHIICSPIWCVCNALCRVRQSYSVQCIIHTPNKTAYNVQPHCRNMFQRRVSTDYLNDYNFSEAQMPRFLMMVV